MGGEKNGTNWRPAAMLMCVSRSPMPTGHCYSPRRKERLASLAALYITYLDRIRDERNGVRKLAAQPSVALAFNAVSMSIT